MGRRLDLFNYPGIPDRGRRPRRESAPTVAPRVRVGRRDTGAARGEAGNSWPGAPERPGSRSGRPESRAAVGERPGRGPGGGREDWPGYGPGIPAWKALLTMVCT